MKELCFLFLNFLSFRCILIFIHFYLEGINVVYVVYDHLTLFLGAFSWSRFCVGSLIVNSFCEVAVSDAACCSDALHV